MTGNRSLDRAKTAKQDEFYTQLSDIEKEMRYYRRHFTSKTVLCNCDDPFESNFFKFFVLNFNRLGLKKLIATCYAGSPITGTQLSMFDLLGGDARVNVSKPYKAVVTTVYDVTGDGGVDMLDVAELFKSGENELTELEGDGDFRSPECVELLKEADIVVTNPPFSLFREYIALLMEYEKHFIVIGNQNAITYKEIFPLLMENKMWLGVPFEAGNAYFEVPEGADTSRFAKGVFDSETRLVKFRNCCWFTNLDIKKRHEELILVRRYAGHEDEYPKYDNYDAIEVSKVADIPDDYFEGMGVPITFLDKWNPEQFEILGADFQLARPQPLANGKTGTGRFYVIEREREAFVLSCGHSEEAMRGALVSMGVPEESMTYCSGVMGVPITFLDKYNPGQFAIVGLDRYTVPKEFLVGGRVAVGGKPRYARVLIRSRRFTYPQGVQL